MFSIKLSIIILVSLFFLTGFSAKRECPRIVEKGDFIIEIDRKCNIKKISIDTE